MACLAGQSAAAAVSAFVRETELLNGLRLVTDCLALSGNMWPLLLCSIFLELLFLDGNERYEMKSARGRSCNGTVKEIVPCNPGLGEVPRRVQLMVCGEITCAYLYCDKNPDGQDRDPHCGNSKRVQNCALGLNMLELHSMAS